MFRHNEPVRGSISLRIAPAVFFVSFAVIGWQLALMRCLLISKYHHFSFLIVSCALLGFGASGVVLSLARPWFERLSESLFRWGIVALAISLPICFRLGEMVPLSVFFSSDSFGTFGWWAVFWLIHSIPFFLAGGLIGLALMTAGTRLHSVYAANLCGGAAGSLGCIGLMWLFPANGLVLPFSLSIIVGAVFLLKNKEQERQRIYKAVLVFSGIVLIAAQVVGADVLFPLAVDQYKSLAYVKRLVDQGSAEQKALRYGPRGRIELFSGPSFHTLLSLSSTEPPPPMDLLLRDGFTIGSVLDIRRPQDARFLDFTLSAIPYRLLKPNRILILGDAGGLYVWRARLSSATEVVWLYPDRNIAAILESHPSNVLNDSKLRVIIAEPRAFLDSTDLKFDIIHLAGLEGFAPGSVGIGGLREDYTATVEGFEQCLNALTSRGVACVIRGIQEPARDNIKIPATWIEAMERMGIDRPGNRILMARDELSMVTLAARYSFSLETVTAFREVCRNLSWDVEWFPGIEERETNRVHRIPGPQGSSVSWYHFAVKQLLSNDRNAFYGTWIANIRPATDDRPFFHDFFRLASLSILRETFGPLWPTRSEMGFLLLVMTAVWTTFIAATLLPAPIVSLVRGTEAAGVTELVTMGVFFAALGTGFMFLEMSFIQIFSRFLGEPILAAALVFGGLLLSAGLGSLAQPLVTERIPWGMRVPTAGIILLILVESAVLPRVSEAAAGLAQWLKTLLGLAFIVPLGFLMGMPFPWGLSAINRTIPGAVPLAWAINGFASVVATSAAVILAMTYGFSSIFVLTAAAYFIAGILSPILERRSAQSCSGLTERH